jgi:hypothetical protein
VNYSVLRTCCADLPALFFILYILKPLSSQRKHIKLEQPICESC